MGGDRVGGEPKASSSIHWDRKAAIGLLVRLIQSLTAV